MSTGTSGSGGTRRLGDTLSGLAVALGCVLFLGGFVWAAVEYQPYSVPTGSMQPAVRPGDRILAQRIHGEAVHRGDIVVFSDPAWGNVPEVKRVVGVGGDRVACCAAHGRLTVDGRPVTEPYLAKTDGGPASATPFSVTVPAGRVFLMGDNRMVSLDSRSHMEDAAGTVPLTEISGRMVATLWPTDRVGTVTPTRAFAALPGGTSPKGPLVPLFWAVIAGVVLIFGGAAHGPVSGLGRRRAARRAAADADVPVGGTA